MSSPIRAARRQSSVATRSAGRGSVLAGALLLLVLAATGCQQPVRFTNPRVARRLMETVNANFSRIDRPLDCKDARVSFNFRDEHGLPRTILSQPARLLFNAPRCLYFDIRHNLAGTVAHVGSNDETYWLWIDFDQTRKLWWGTWQALERGEAKRLAVPPDQLLAVLLFQPIPTELVDGPPPMVYRLDRYDVLVFTREDIFGWPYAAREILLDRQQSRLPVQITDFNREGDVVMVAKMRQYRPIDETGVGGPRTPRSYMIDWPLEHASMRLSLSQVSYRTSAVPCDFPTGWRGADELLDQAPTGGAPPEDWPVQGAP